MLTRRHLLLAASAATLSGCKVFDSATCADSGLRHAFMATEGLTMRTQRALMGDRLAPEFTRADILQSQHPNGSTDPRTPEYLALSAAGFADYRLTVGGRVARPLSLSLADLRAMGVRTQITRHDCVEGWSCIAEWTGTPLGAVLDRAGLTAGARYAVFHGFDEIERSLGGAVTYYESIDMVDAYHPQTILAWGMNGGDLPVPNGAPLRLRVERQLGYKMAKYVRHIDLVADFADLGRGRGSYWADRGYEWYAGI